MPDDSQDGVQGVISPVVALKRSFAIGVPTALTAGASGDPAPVFTDKYANYLRVGGVNPDEQSLQEDPNATASPVLIGANYTNAFADGTLAYSLDSTQLAAPEAYVRLGPPAKYELWLATNPDSPAAPAPPDKLADTAATAGAFGSKGLLLHTTDTYQLFAPKILQTAKSISTTSDSVSDWSGTSLTATYVGKMVASCTYVTKDITSVLSNATVQTADNFTSTMGSMAASIIGNNTTVWAGNDTSTGVGSLLWSNYGTTQNVFGGQIVNITNGNIDVQGWGEAKVSDFSVVAPELIQLSIAGTALTTGLSTRILGALKAFNIAAGIALTLATVLPNVQVDVQTGLDDSDSSVTAAMDIYKTEMRVLIGLVAVIQLMAIAAGMAAQSAAAAAAAESSASISLTSGAIVLSAGGTEVTIGNDGFSVNAGDPVRISAALTAQAMVAGQNAVSDGLLAAFYASDAVLAAYNDPTLWNAQVLNAQPLPAGPPGISLTSMLVRTSALQVETGMYV